jgi:hypothetical protein
MVLPLGLIAEVVAEAGARERRRRLLPAAAVMVFVLGLCLFSPDGYAEVARKLAGWLGPLAGPGSWRPPGTSALAKARRRLGAAPFELLFTRLRGPLAGTGTPGAAFGRALLAMSVDGTMLDVPHTAANIAAFGPPPHGAKDGGFPQVRLLALAGCGTRGIADAVFGPRKASEQDLARQIAARGMLGPGDLVLADRNFCGHPVAAALTRTGADILIRAKAGQLFPVLAALPDGSWQSVLPDPAADNRRRARNYKRRKHGTLPPDTSPPEGIPIRVIEADITATPAGGQPATTRYRLITTMLDPTAAPAAQVAACYAQRWEAETGFRELKTFLRGPGRILRSQDATGITQEIYALLCAHQLIHAARTAAAAGPGLDPDQISYTTTLRAIRRSLTTRPPGHPGAAQAITAEALSMLLPARRPRSTPRETRSGPAKRRKARAAATAPLTYTITITPTPATPTQPNL